MSNTNQWNGKGSVSREMVRATTNDPAAQTFIYDRYFERLVKVARQALRMLPESQRDAETVASSAMREYLMRAGAGQLSELGDRESLMKFLGEVARNKAITQLRRAMAKKRGAGVTGDAYSGSAASKEEAGEEQPFAWAEDAEPNPEEQLVVTEMFVKIKESLPEKQLRAFLMQLDGHSVADAAAELGCSEAYIKLLRKTAKATLQQQFGGE